MLVKLFKQFKWDVIAQSAKGMLLHLKKKSILKTKKQINIQPGIFFYESFIFYTAMVEQNINAFKCKAIQEDLRVY